MGNGLEIMLDIQQDEYLPIWRETSKLQTCLYALIPSHATAATTCRGLTKKKYSLHPALRLACGK